MNENQKKGGIGLAIVSAVVGAGIAYWLWNMWNTSKNTAVATPAVTPASVTTNSTTTSDTPAAGSYTVSISTKASDACGVGDNTNVTKISVTDDGSGFAGTKTFNSPSLASYSGIYNLCNGNGSYVIILCSGSNTANVASGCLSCPVSATATPAAAVPAIINWSCDSNNTGPYMGTHLQIHQNQTQVVMEWTMGTGTFNANDGDSIVINVIAANIEDGDILWGTTGTNNLIVTDNGVNMYVLADPNQEDMGYTFTAKGGHVYSITNYTKTS